MIEQMPVDELIAILGLKDVSKRKKLELQIRLDEAYENLWRFKKYVEAHYDFWHPKPYTPCQDDLIVNRKIEFILI